MRVELRVSRKERQTAGPARKRSVIVDVKQRAGEGRLGSGFAQDVIAIGAELRSPFLFALLNLWDYVMLHRLLPLGGL